METKMILKKIIKLSKFVRLMKIGMKKNVKEAFKYVKWFIYTKNKTTNRGRISKSSNWSIWPWMETKRTIKQERILDMKKIINYFKNLSQSPFPKIHGKKKGKK